MDELHQALDKFEREADKLVHAVDPIDPDDPNAHRISIALSQAKRVRRESTILVRALAHLRSKS